MKNDPSNIFPGLLQLVMIWIIFSVKGNISIYQDYIKSRTLDLQIQFYQASRLYKNWLVTRRLFV